MNRNYCVLDISSEDQAVLFYDHEIGKFAIEHRSAVVTVPAASAAVVIV